MAGQYRFKDQNGNIVAQISASVEGAIAFSGSVVDFTQANNVILGNVQLAGTASNALLLDGFDSQAFAFTSSIHPFTASIAGTNTFTSSTSARLNSIETITASNISRLNAVEIITASNVARLNSLETTSASVNTTNTTQNTRLTSLENKTGSLATTGSNTFSGDQIISGTVYIQNNLVVQGSSSLQNITASAVSIGTNTILLNTANPSIRFAGISAIDSGSASGKSGSLYFDSTDNEWIFVHQLNTAVTSSTVITGPETYDSVGNETRLTTNAIPKAQSGFHIIDSCLFDNGTTTCIKNNLITTGTNLLGNGTAYSNGTTIKGASNDYQLTILQSNVNNAGWGVVADTSGNLSVSRYSGGAYGTCALNISLGGVACFANTICSAGSIIASSNIISSTCIGIGTASPSNKLHIENGGIFFQASNVDTDGLHQAYTWNPSTSNLSNSIIGSVSSDYLSVDPANGSLGIRIGANSGLYNGVPGFMSAGMQAMIYANGGDGALGGGYLQFLTKTNATSFACNGNVRLTIDPNGIASFSCQICSTGLVSSGIATFTAQGAASYGTINLESDDPFIRFYDNGVGSTTDKKKWDIRAIGVSGYESFDIRTINDVNTVFSTKLSILHSGIACFSNTVCSPQFTGGFVCAVGGLNVRGASTTWSTLNIFPDNPGGAGAQCNTVLAGSITGCTGWGPQLRFSGAPNGFIDIGQDCVGGFVVETSDTPRLIVSQNGYITRPSQPFAYGGLSTNQSISALTFTTLAFQTNQGFYPNNVSSSWNNSTYAFIAPTTGVYLVTLSLMTDTIGQVALHVNGTRKHSIPSGPFTGSTTWGGSAMIPLNAGESLTLQGYGGTSGTLTANIYHTWFSIYLL